MKKLTSAEIKSQLKSIPKWKVVQGKLYREFVFKDFNEAFGFMKKCARAAEAMDHHPEWTNAYKNVKVYLTTHDVEGLSELDFKLAQKMDKLLNLNSESV